MAKIRVLSYALVSLAFAGIALSSCSDSGHGTSSQVEEQTLNDTGINVLTSVFPSPKELNPYSVENMNKTFKDLVLANNPNAKDIPKLEANFLYVRFLPYGKQGAYELKTYDTSLVLFKHPMDYNEIREPAVYVDKTLPDSIVPYFASVPVGYEFGPTPYEILQELFLTQPLEEQDEGDGQEGSRFVKAKKASKSSKKVAAYLKSQGLAPYHLEMMAFPDSERFTEAGSGSSKALAKSVPLDMDNIGTDNIVAWHLPWVKTWRPKGTLKYNDEKLKRDTVLVGVRVTTGYKFYWRSTKTDSKGNFESPEKWTFSVDYEVHFDSDQFLLEDGHIPWYYLFGETLKITNKGTKNAWYPTFGGNRAKWCVVWTAAWNYWNGDIGDLQSPRQKKWWNQSLNLKVYYEDNNDFDKDKNSNSSTGEYYYDIFTENILINTWNRSHLGIYGTTIHEIAHATHYANLDLSAGSVAAGAGMGYLANVAGYTPLTVSAVVLGVNGWQSYKYSDLEKKLKESYADGISRYLTTKHYGDWSGSYKNWDKGYTGIFEDLEDADPTFARTNNDENPCDRVSGITVPMAEKVFFKSDSWNGFKNNLMKAYPNGFSNEKGGKVSYTAEDMDALFKYWKTGETSCLKDFRDGKVYKTAKVGTQKWLAENLNYNANGSVCYGNYTANCDKYGRLYDWSTAMALPSSCNGISCSKQISRKTKRGSYHGICPEDWRVPSVEDWNKLARYIDGNNSTHSPYDSPTAGIYLKTKSGWGGGYIDDIYRNGNGEDKYGFSALPGGIGKPDGTFKDMGFNGDWWSATEYDSSGAYRFDVYYGDKAGWSDIEGSNRRFDKSSLFSVRCLEN